MTRYTELLPRVRSQQRSIAPKRNQARSSLLLLGIYALLIGVCARLFYWQVMSRDRLQSQADSQYRRTVTHTGQRGKIFTSDGALLVTNAPAHLLFVQPQLLTMPAQQVSALLTPILFEITPEVATQPALLQSRQAELTSDLTERLGRTNRKWVALRQKITPEQKAQIQALNIRGLGFDEFSIRAYPEASVAAHILGFVGKNSTGDDQGYFGIEGGLDKELRGQQSKQSFNKDALGLHLFFDTLEQQPPMQGRDVTLTIRRDIQHAVEDALKKGMEKYGARAGEVIVMEPATGKILAMASFPHYEPANYSAYPSELHKNPSSTDTYEPGSTFKALTVSIGLDTAAVHEHTPCTQCASARTIGKYTIKTWNDVYTPNISVQDGLAKSDNTAMIFIAQAVGQRRFVEYLQQFGIGEATGIELQEDTKTPFRKQWGEIDLATASFGQGIATTGLQMVRAVGAIANEGKLMRPHIVASVTDHQKNTTIPVEPAVSRIVIKPETAKRVARMMEYAASQGEAKWTSSKTHSVAGKTGTAQIPIDGHYDAEKTIASFVGFSPVEHPKFVMLVKLREPQSSPWAAETAAPLWYDIANKLYLLLNIPADRS